MSRLLILYLCGLTLRSLIFAAVAGIITIRTRSVVSRHAVWTGFLGCLLLMPLADALLPAAMVPARAPEIVLPVQTFVTVAAEPVFTPAGAVSVILPRPRWDWWEMAAFLWIAVAALLLCRLALACGEIARIRRAGLTVSPARIPSPAFRFRTLTLRESGSVNIPLTVGLWNPVLILPLGWRDWDDWKLRAVLAHELTHVRRLDWAITAAASFGRCVFWFNPLSWWLERHLSSLAEQSSDEASVHATGDAPRYAETLLQFASVAKRGRRWIGGVAMAQYKISSRIERVLRLQKAGSGVLSRAGWVAVCGFAIPVLYVSAAAQSRTTTQMPTLSPAEIVRVVQQGLTLAEPAAVAATPTQQPTQPAQPPIPGGAAVGAEVLTPTARAGIFRYWAGWTPSTQQAQLPQNNNAPALPAPTASTAAPVNPDLVGEIRLILAPVEQAQKAVPGEIQIQTSTGNNRYTGTAVWNVRNGALNPNSWTRNGIAFTFALTGAQGRTLSFETSHGGAFSYGCPDCSFLASESGVSALSANVGPGIVFRLSPDGKSVFATCRAVECRAGSEVAWPGNPAETTGVRNRTLKDSESFEFPVPQQPPVDANNSGLRCFSVFGNIKADGTPFTAADCPGGVAITPSSVMFFSATP